MDMAVATAEAEECAGGDAVPAPGLRWGAWEWGGVAQSALESEGCDGVWGSALLRPLPPPMSGRPSRPGRRRPELSALRRSRGEAAAAACCAAAWAATAALAETAREAAA
jgi:hypothetical protein